MSKYNILKTITRKTMLYKTDVEYGDYTINHVLGCSHGCKYPCYAFLMAKRFGKVASYQEWLEPKLVSNTLELLDIEIPKLKDKISSVQLCFTTDPFMYGYEQVKSMTLSAIKKLNNAGIKCTVLTKGVLPQELADLSTDNEYGITLISLDETYREKFEPGAASYRTRIESLLTLHDAGFKTWVSVEPYPTPNLIQQNLTDVLEEVRFVDRIIFGKANYNTEVSSYSGHKAFYNQCAVEVMNFSNAHRITCHIKKGTQT